ncbi:MAG: DUF2062 domain-containing protein [Desulfonatronovibrionaceae bacterium]
MKVKPRTALGRVFRYWQIRFLRIRESPHSVSMGLAIGVFTGCLPIIPFQTAAALALAFLFRCSKITAALGTWITNPLYAPFVYYGLYQVGRMIIPAGRRQFDADELTLCNLLDLGWDFFWLMFSGGLMVGTILAVLVYTASIRMVRFWHDKRARALKLKKLKKLKKP